MAQARKHANKGLPPNLYNRGGYFSYRDPVSGREFGLGRNRASAVNQAIEANIRLMQDDGGIRLIDRLDGSADLNFHSWLDSFEEILNRRKLSAKTLRDYGDRVSKIKKSFPPITLKRVTTQHIAGFLNEYTLAGKEASARLYRSFFVDIFNEAIMEGHITVNPAQVTRKVTEEVKRKRMDLERYQAIRTVIPDFAKWGDLVMDLALVTGQRRSDVVKMSWDDIGDEKFKVIQSKTGAKLLLPLSLRLDSAGLSLSDIINRCKMRYGNQGYLIKNRYGKMLNNDQVTKIFSNARDSLNFEWGGTPAPFHEIRSLSARLYKDEQGEEFSQRLLGHKSATMTATYHDEREVNWVVV
ncbi:tyrosine-type recombinase/integrase [Cedecea sp.]|uniref:tyrosine-type recombinase/integrase n=1 Tax=Cedecea sp. TaxID=1970739 RepID=UPI002F407A4F